MPTATLANGPKLGLLYNASIDQAYPDQFRAFIQSLDQLIMGSVITSSFNVPPASPNPGDAYLLTSGNPSGAWAGQFGNIAVWDAQLTNSGTNTVVPGWIFLSPRAGWIIWNTALNSLFVYTNSETWAPIAAATSSALMTYSDQISTATVTATANTVKIWSFTISSQTSFSAIGYSVATPDTSTSNFYSLGIYSSAGSSMGTAGLLSSTGPLEGFTFAQVGGYLNQAMIGQNVLPAGNYFLAFTGSSSTAALHTAPSSFMGVSNYSSGSSSGGAMPTSITVPTSIEQIDITRPAICLF